MEPNFLLFLVGLVLGANLGVIAAGLLFSAAKIDKGDGQ